MENTPKETPDEPVLLRWEMPVGRRWLFVVISLAEAALMLLLWSVVQERLPDGILIRLASIGAVVTLFSLFVPPFLHSSAKLGCKESGLSIKSVIGLRYTVPWSAIRTLRPDWYGLVVLEWKGNPSRLYLPIPPDVRDNLIAILRETSNARIIGFEPEES